MPHKQCLFLFSLYYQFVVSSLFNPRLRGGDDLEVEIDDSLVAAAGGGVVEFALSAHKPFAGIGFRIDYVTGRDFSRVGVGAVFNLARVDY